MRYDGSSADFCHQIIFCPVQSFEGMVILVCYDDQIVAEINYEKGIDHIEIEVVSSIEGSTKRIFPLISFFKALEEAKAIAVRCAKEDEDRKNE